MSSVQKSFNEAVKSNDLDSLLDTARKVCSYNIKTRNIQLPPSMDREDIIQEVLLKVYKAFDKFDASKASANTYFNRVIDRIMIDCIRKINTIYKTVGDGALNYSTNECIDNVLYADQFDKCATFAMKHCSNIIKSSEGSFGARELLLDLMNMLTDRQIRVFKLRYCGFTFNEIAKRLNVSYPTVMNDWKRVKQQAENLMA